jgi:hypothetical protein
MAIFRNGWAEAYRPEGPEGRSVLGDRSLPSEPFSVDGVVTPKAMEYIRGYVDGLRALREEVDGPEAS